MRSLNNAVFALATGLLAFGLASDSASAQTVPTTAGWYPGQPFAVMISTASGIPLTVLLADEIPLASDGSIILSLPDLGSGDQGLVIAVVVQLKGLSTGSQKQRVAPSSAVLTTVVFEPAPDLTVQASQKMLSISAEGMVFGTKYDLSDDIVWNDDCIYVGSGIPGVDSLSSDDAKIDSPAPDLQNSSQGVATSLDVSKGL